MTMDELNAFYNKMSVYGDTYGEGNFTLPYKDPFPKSIPIDPNAGQPPILEPLMPPMKYINQGGDNNGGIKALAGMDYGYDSVFDNTNITSIMPNGEEQPQTNFEYDIEEGSIPQSDIDNNKTSGVGIQSLIDLYKKYSPMGMLYRAGSNVATNTQKYFADKKEKQKLEAERLEAEKLEAERLEAEKIEKAAVTMQTNNFVSPSGVTGGDNKTDYVGRSTQYGTHDATKTRKEAQDNRESGRGQQTSAPSRSRPSRSAPSRQSRHTSGPGGLHSGYARGGRIRYGKGGIVSL